MIHRVIRVNRKIQSAKRTAGNGPAIHRWERYVQLRGRGRSRLGVDARSHALFALVLILLTAHCSMRTAFAQPGVPQPNSPLYGGGQNQGQTATGLPAAL